ncbi:hypothetical protein BLNAU_24023 [Blattamonas nauphoetae]|uniref:Uncharacterized protein n=1 Tax=Blattamonas nauphoetae TaxID=2049346 RepID=A0ABQ9WPJ9_9EUKA|nr:hypothetical protein BLNAU_24023 [Blattamonas nauphoetae]
MITHTGFETSSRPFGEEREDADPTASRDGLAERGPRLLVCGVHLNHSIPSVLGQKWAVVLLPVPGGPEKRAPLEWSAVLAQLSYSILGSFHKSLQPSETLGVYAAPREVNDFR